MKTLIILLAASFHVFSNPTPIMKCESADYWVDAKVMVSKSSGYRDVYDSFQVDISFKEEEDRFRTTSQIRYAQMYNQWDKQGSYLFHRGDLDFSISIEPDMSASLSGPICGNFGDVSTCVLGADYFELKCEYLVDIDQLSFHPWIDYMELGHVDSGSY